MHTNRNRFTAFAVAHDSLPAFHAAYLVLTLLAAALLNVGAFVILIVAHAGLDLVKYHEVHGRAWPRTLQSTLRESLLDIFLLSGALVLAVYLHHGTGIVAVSGIVRAETSLLRGLLLLLPRLGVLWNTLWVFTNVRYHLLRSPEASGPWTVREQLTLAGAACALLLLAASPSLFGAQNVLQTLTGQLVPWRV